MATFRTLEDIEAWQKARELARQIYAVSKNGAFSRDFGLRDQVRRASVSIVANIAEGFERGGSKEFLQFLSMAKGSVGEVKAHLFVAFDQGYVTKAALEDLLKLADETSRLIGGLMRYLRDSAIRGPKYHLSPVGK